MKRLLIIFLVLSLPIGAFASGMFDAMNAKNILADIDVQNVTPKDNNEQKEEKKEEENKKEKKQIIKNVANKVKDGVSSTVDKVKTGVSNTVEKVKGGINNAKDRLSASGRAEAKINRKAENAKKNIDKFCKKKKNSASTSCKPNTPDLTKADINTLKTNSLNGLTDDNAEEKLEEFETKLSEILTKAGFKEVDKETNEQEDEEVADATETEDDATPEKKLTKEQQEQKVAELRENYEDMKEIENSFENRTLGATGMATMGMGGMELATSLAEDKADDAAEQQMKAYLATFSCTYANGKRFKGGESAIELPGGNELINLYSEYVGLANDLKERKSALGMRAGIESEPILDSATSGLYDDISVGKTSGAFTSLARALSDPNSEDADAWAAQRAETAEKKKNALTTIGAGAVATIAGNMLINSNNPEERSAEILKKYEKLKTSTDDLTAELSNTPSTQSCKGDGVSSGKYPDCTCKDSNSYYSSSANECISCGNDKKPTNNGSCTCNDTTAIRGPNGTCSKCTINNVNRLREDNSCGCKQYATLDEKDNICRCNSGYRADNGKCTSLSEDFNTIINEFNTDGAFEPGKIILTEEAKKTISKHKRAIEQALASYGDQTFCLKIIGHTDKTGFKTCQGKTECDKQQNIKLSKERATAVLKELGLTGKKNVMAVGKGQDECDAKDDNDPICRRITFELEANTNCKE